MVEFDATSLRMAKTTMAQVALALADMARARQIHDQRLRLARDDADVVRLLNDPALIPSAARLQWALLPSLGRRSIGTRTTSAQTRR